MAPPSMVLIPFQNVHLMRDSYWLACIMTGIIPLRLYKGIWEMQLSMCDHQH